MEIRDNLRINIAKSLMAWLTCILLCLTAAGCGGGSDTPPPSPSASIPAPPVLQPVAAPANPASPAAPLPPLAEDQPYVNTTVYSLAAKGNVAQHDEGAAVTHHRIKLGGKDRTYTATIGHLISRNPNTNAPEAAIFYTAYTLDGEDPATRPVTFFFNGGPGSPALFLHMGSFGPERVFTTNGAAVTGPNDVRFGDNPQTLLDQSDLVFVDPVGTGYSVAIAPFVNSDFWGVDRDNASLSAFISRYLVVNNRGLSPVMLYGESYGGPRTAMMSYVLHATYGIKLSGLVMQAPALNFYESYVTGKLRRSPTPEFLLPTWAATARFHGVLLDEGLKSQTAPAVFDQANALTFGDLYAVQQKYSYQFGSTGTASVPGLNQDLATLAPQLAKYIGVPPEEADKRLNDLLDILAALGSRVLDSAILPGKVLGAYDTRKVLDGSVPGLVSDLLVYDPSLDDVAAYGQIFDSYRYHQLKYQAVSNYGGLSNSITQVWNRTTTYPDKTKLPFPDATIHLAAEMMINPDMKVMTTAGYYDAVVPAAEVQWDMMSVFDKVPKAQMDKNYVHANYEGGHMMYADDGARTQMRAALATFYANAILGSQ